jgi:hypothetical protein
MPLALFALVIWRWDLGFCQGQHASGSSYFMLLVITGITDLCHHALLLVEMGSLKLPVHAGPELQSCSVSQVTRTTGTSHKHPA